MQQLSKIALLLPLAAMPAWADNDSPYTRPDGTWVSLDGTAVETRDDGFVLDYGRGTIFVEMDGWGWYADQGAGLMDGDKVRVFGEIDDDFAEIASVEASSVYVESLGGYFYANPADEEDYRHVINAPIVIGYTEVIGTVSDVDGREFTVDYGDQEITIDTSEMPYNPLDNKGFQKIDEGDLVTVTGALEADLAESRELVASTIITLAETS